jgi:hypothetical protein
VANNLIPFPLRRKSDEHGEKATVTITVPVSPAVAAAVESAALWAGKSRDAFLQEFLSYGFPEARG